MAADFDEHRAGRPGPASHGAGEEPVFASDERFDLERLVEGEAPSPPEGDEADNARLLGGTATIDFDHLDSHPPRPARRGERAPRRGAEVARRAAASSAMAAPGPKARSSRRSLVAAFAGMAAAVVVVALGVGSGVLIQPAPARLSPVQQAAPARVAPATPQDPIAEAPSTPEQPVALARSKPDPAPDTAVVHRPTVVTEATVSPAPLPELAAVEAPPVVDVEVAVAPPEPPVAPQSDELADCRSEVAADHCWRQRLADAERLLVAAHLNARLAGLPGGDLRVGIDEWMDASNAAEDRPQARLSLYSARIERVEAVAAAHAAEGLAAPGFEAAPTSTEPAGGP